MKKIILIIVIVAVVVVAGGVLAPSIFSKITGEDVVTSSQLEKAIDMDQLSTAEFVYNGIAEKYREKNPEKIQCYISYHATVKVGIQMDDIEFDINQDEKTITPILPSIEVNIADVEEDSISYIPKNPDLELKEVYSLCKEDAINEANNSEELYEMAEENLQSVIEALLTPILSKSGY
ncbi:MAG: DUF4230 domain-containing protein, partial [Clostridiales bacterium]|nr:DUF4230 domain-containing protein [Clostridiales bacterium]